MLGKGGEKWPCFSTGTTVGRVRISGGRRRSRGKSRFCELQLAFLNNVFVLYLKKKNQKPRDGSSHGPVRNLI